MKRLPVSLFVFFLCAGCSLCAQTRALVFQSDFGTRDGAVAAMKGVAFTVSNDLRIFDLTHEIPAFNVWKAAYRLNQACSYWPAGTVFVSIIDPGVGSERRSIVMKSKSGHYFVTPDNGTLTLVAEALGIDEVRQIDETKNRLRNSYDSYTFHGRDVYAYTGARLAAGVITFEGVGKKVSNDIVRLTYQKAVLDGDTIKGNIDVLDVQYGNVWTNIPQRMINAFGLKYGADVRVMIFHDEKLVYDNKVRFDTTFGGVGVGEPIAYLNSLLNFSVAINRGNFADQFDIESGPRWTVTVTK